MSYDYRVSEFEDLINKKILNVEYGDDQITFIVDNPEGIKRVKFKAYGDCCSSSYIESLDDPEVFSKAILTEVQVEEGDNTEVREYEYHSWTFYKFTTTKGRCTLSFRNESNGYYSGHLERVE